MSIKSSFIQLKLFQKIELYIIVIIAFILLNYLLEQYLDKNKTIPKVTNQIATTNYALLKQKIIKKDKNQIIKEINNISTKFNIAILHSNYSKSNIKLKLKGKHSKVINFLDYLCSHFNIENFNIIKQDSIILSEVNIKIKYYFNPNLEYNLRKDIINPFVNYTRTSRRTEENLKLNAIVANNIMINNKCYRLFDIVNRYKIIEINKNSVKLKHLKSKKDIILKVYDDK